jgi:tetratricopeptide (TPR) repeat protein
MPTYDSDVRRAGLMTAAERDVSANKLLDAIRKYETLLGDNATNPELLARLGTLHARTGNNTAAIAEFQRAARFFIDAGHISNAIAAYKRITKLDPARLDVFEALGELYARQNLPREAASQLTALANHYAFRGEHAKAHRLRERSNQLLADVETDETAEAVTAAAAAAVQMSAAGVPLILTKADLSIFLCHASEDKPHVRDLYRRLQNDQLRPWLDEEDLLPGQNWQVEIPKAVRRSHVVVVCLSRKSINKAGYLQKEIKLALDVLDEQPEGIIFIIPARIEPCEVPQTLRHLQYVDLFAEHGYGKLKQSLLARARQLGFSAYAG